MQESKEKVSEGKMEHTSLLKTRSCKPFLKTHTAIYMSETLDRRKSKIYMRKRYSGSRGGVWYSGRGAKVTRKESNLRAPEIEVGGCEREHGPRNYSVSSASYSRIKGVKKKEPS